MHLHHQPPHLSQPLLQNHLKINYAILQPSSNQFSPFKEFKESPSVFISRIKMSKELQKCMHNIRIKRKNNYSIQSNFQKKRVLTQPECHQDINHNYTSFQKNRRLEYASQRNQHETPSSNSLALKLQILKSKMHQIQRLPSNQQKTSDLINNLKDHDSMDLTNKLKQSLSVKRNKFGCNYSKKAKMFSDKPETKVEKHLKWMPSARKHTSLKPFVLEPQSTYHLDAWTHETRSMFPTLYLKD